MRDNGSVGGVCDGYEDVKCVCVCVCVSVCECVKERERERELIA